MRLMAEARLVVGVHGAGLTNAIFCRPGTAMLEITSTQYIRRSRSYADIAMFRGFPYAIAVVDQVGESWVVANNRGNDLEIAPDALPELRRLAETLLDRAAAG
jgi:capsular polysaccharide biosynthesis protein